MAESIEDLRRQGREKEAYSLGRKIQQERPLRADELAPYSICAYYAGDYSEGLNATVNLVSYHNIGEVYSTWLQNMAFYDKHLTDFTYYPVHVIERLMNNSSRSGITFTITTCKRLDLFTRTMNSFLNCCLDVDLIEKFICIDDNSSSEDRAAMVKLYPFFTFYFKSPSERGHHKSMNILRKMIKTPLFFHCEDDWQFFIRRKYITDLTKIISAATDIGQVLVNRNYAETLAEVRDRGSVSRYIDNLHFLLHRYDNNLIKEGAGHSYWPHFSLRPGLNRTEILRRVGPFLELPGFESEYAARYTKIGFNTCFLPAIHCLHIGKLTSQKDGLNSYDLNQQDQWRTTYRREKYRVRVVGFWTSNEEMKRSWSFMTTNGTSWKNLELVTEDPDYEIVIQQNQKNIPNRSIVFQTEPVPLQYDLSSLAAYLRLEDRPYAGNWHLNISYRDLCDYKNSKTKDFCVIFSSKYVDPGHIKRIDFMKHYQSRDDLVPVDVYGYDNKHGFKNYLGPLPEYSKDVALNSYRYTFQCENHSTFNYFTEKIYDAIFTETLCFYWGCPNLEDYVGADCFVRLSLEDFDADATLIDNAIRTNLYETKLPAIRKAKDFLLSKFTFFDRVSAVIEELPIPSYAINLKRRPDRYRTISKTLQDLANFHRFNAFDGRELKYEGDVAKYYSSDEFTKRSGSVGCALSHIHLWRQLVREEVVDQYLILEDDVTVRADFREKLLIVKDMEFDILFLGASFQPQYRTNACYDENSSNLSVISWAGHRDRYSWLKYIGGMFGYIIRKSAAVKLLALAEASIDCGIDYWLYNHFDKFNVKFVEPYLVYTGVFGIDTDDTDIQNN